MEEEYERTDKKKQEAEKRPVITATLSSPIGADAGVH